MDSRAAPADLSAGNRELLQTLAIEASTILENARLLEEEREKIRIEDELKIARDIQQGLLPAALPAIRLVSRRRSSIPSTQVGGDYFDVRQVSPDVWAAVVADVSGKGVSSALLASLLQGSFLMASADPWHVESIMTRLNTFLLERTRGEKYATIFYCTARCLRPAELRQRRPSRAISGERRRPHPQAPHLRNAGRNDRRRAVSKPCRPSSSRGDKMVIYSDGLTEAENADGAFFDTERLRVCLRDHAGSDAIAMHTALRTAVDRFAEGGAMRDDVTALVIEYAP